MTIAIEGLFCHIKLEEVHLDVHQAVIAKTTPTKNQAMNTLTMQKKKQKKCILWLTFGGSVLR